MKDRFETFVVYLCVKRAGNAAVGIVTGYGLEDQGVGVPVPMRSKISILRVVQNGSGVHPASYPVSNMGSFPGGEAAET
jgi:hypothetical protein